MPDLISKLQYRYSEKGEFADKKSRSLAETLQLLKAINWDEQRGGEVGLTCPSITIIDETGNYLKVATYFNGKFCLYYFDIDHHLYEHPVANIDDADPFITAFFNGQLDTTQFERHRGLAGAAKHFEDATFFYRASAGKFYPKFIFIVFMILSQIVCISFIIMDPKSTLFTKLIFGVWMIVFVPLFTYSQFQLAQYYIRLKDIVLELSANADVFKYGYEGQMNEYHKQDISEIKMFGAVGKAQSPLSISEIIFKNGFKLYIPVLLIEAPLFVSKFPYIKVTSVSQKADYQPVLDGYRKGKL